MREKRDSKKEELSRSAVRSAEESEKEWWWVSIPKAMLRLVDDAIKEHPEYGYRSRNDFVADAVRRRLRELGIPC